MSDTHSAISIFITLLLIASGVAMLTKWVRVPYTLALVAVGLIISPLHFLPPVHISPDLILLIFLPALLFEAAWNLKLAHLRANLVPVLTLAVFGVVLSVGVIGLVVHYGVGLPFPTALLFGAVISATDPVSVLALFRKCNVPQRLGVVIEGESLFNDGTAAVLFRILLGVTAGATRIEGAGTLAAHSLWEFCLVVCGGVAVGAGVGFLSSRLTAHFDDHLLEITLTTIAAYGSFLLAESINVSPVIAVLSCGFVVGNYGRSTGMSENTQVAVGSFWEYAAFVVNSLVFLLIGLEVSLPVLAEHRLHILWAVIATVASRAVAVYGLLLPINFFTEPISWRWRHVLFWGGLRGSLSVALALSLPAALPFRSHLVAMTFGVVIFSLLVQGLTISPLLERLGIKQGKPGAEVG